MVGVRFLTGVSYYIESCCHRVVNADYDLVGFEVSILNLITVITIDSVEEFR